MQRIVVIGLIVLMLALPITAMAQSATPAASSPTAASGDFAGLVDIGGGRRLYLECHGDGQPDGDPGGGVSRVGQILERRSPPSRCATDDGAPRSGPVHPRLCL